jgi:hypothetical protein
MASTKLTDSIRSTIAALVVEQKLIQETVANLETMLGTLSATKAPGKRRGRPPKSPSASRKKAAKALSKSKRRTWTPAQKRAASERQSAAWVKRKKESQ